MITKMVKAVHGAIVYDYEGYPIPHDKFTPVPISPGVVRAIKDGDLEEQGGGSPLSAAPPQQRRRPRAGVAEPSA